MRRPRNWKSAGTVLLLLATGAGSSCGGASDADRALQEQTDEQRPLAAEDRLVERKLVSALDIRREAPGSVRRAFLEYWSAIEYQEWGVAVAFMSEEIRRALEPEYLVAALRAEGESNLPVRPPIRRVVTTRGLATVRYFVRASDGALRPTSISWSRRNGQWYVVYGATLDASYSAAVQQAVQNETDPTASTPSDEAVRAGARALGAQATTLAPPPAEKP